MNPGPLQRPSSDPAQPDWGRETPMAGVWSPARSLMAALRSHQFHRERRGPVHRVLRQLATLRHRFWSAVTGADIPLNCQIGGGLLLPHPNGIVIHPQARIGVNCLIFQQVTIGVADATGAPVIGHAVDIGAGARILGPVRIGDRARIGANAVVLIDVPADAVAVGVPARIVSGG